MKRAVILLACWSLLLGLGACNSRTAPTSAMDPFAPRVSRIDTPALRPARLDHDPQASVRYLASDELEGRGYATAGLESAADYLAETFRRAGLAPVLGHKDFFQHFESASVRTLSRESELAFDGRSLVLEKDFLPTVYSGSGTISGEPVFVGYGISSKKYGYDDYAGIDVNGRPVIAMRFEPHDASGKSRFTGAAWSDEATILNKTLTAIEQGATALILVTPPNHQDSEDTLLGFDGSMGGARGKIPVVHVRRDAVQRLLRNEGLTLASVQADIDVNARPRSFALENSQVRGRIVIDSKPAQLKNVLALLPGTGPLAEEYIVVGAHYDHLGRGGPGSLARGSSEIHNGADDNASGTAALLELAERLARADSGGRAVIFIGFTAEERGLIGSQHFVEHPPVPLEKIAAMVNFDMVGRLKNDTVYALGDESSPAFQPILQKADAASPLQIREFSLGHSGASDDASFQMKKIPTIFFFTGVHPDYHRPSDDADKINYAGLAQVVDLAEDVLQDLRTAPRPPFEQPKGTRIGFGGRGSKVMLGVVPDYGSAEESAGVAISGTVPGSPAEAAGLKTGDVIIGLGDTRIATLYDLTAALNKAEPGEKATVRILRDGDEVEKEVTLAARRGS